MILLVIFVITLLSGGRMGTSFVMSGGETGSGPKRAGQQSWPASTSRIALPLLAAMGSSRKTALAAAAPSGDTNEVVKTVNGLEHRRLGGGDIVVSEIGLGTQRWVSEDLNAPDEAACFSFMDEAILNRGVNLIDTASQYPIPSSTRNPEGRCEEVIGKWMKQNKARDKVVIATKIVGSSHVRRKSILADCDASLKRLQTDHIDVYLLHWPARYSPQSNWGQSLMYHKDAERFYANNAGFEEVVSAMGELIKAGKIRGYGSCNDNCFGLTAMSYTAKMLGVPGPVCLQGDYSLLDRKMEENGVSEASSSIHLNAGFMAYNVLAGGQLTGKYSAQSAPGAGMLNRLFAKRNGKWTDPAMAESYRGRFDEGGWGQTLYRYRSGPAVEATKAYSQLASKYGIKGGLTEMALRWTRMQQPVTTALLGSSSLQQLQQSLDYMSDSQPLPMDLIFEIDRVHMRNRNPIFASTGPYSEYGDAGLIGERIP